MTATPTLSTLSGKVVSARFVARKVTPLVKPATAPQTPFVAALLRALSAFAA